MRAIDGRGNDLCEVMVGWRGREFWRARDDGCCAH